MTPKQGEEEQAVHPPSSLEHSHDSSSYKHTDAQETWEQKGQSSSPSEQLGKDPDRMVFDGLGRTFLSAAG